ncbi:MAG: Hsp70 family protein, partial [Planctomycetes bacterium]|nr:Hsp70 family protein [Planctomycetota bacterium]
MSRVTIDYGIDLGTTNSAIALLNGTRIEVFKNSLGSDCTPSALWIDQKSRLHVGQSAKDRIEDDDQNAASEFKMLMGLQVHKVFERSNKKMTPPELSSWVLKGLKRDVQRVNQEEVRSAVICIPADFDTPQSDATKKASQLAGFVECPLLQEPVAAGLAYGFQSKKDNVYWLVYDLGGGTFDAAILQIRGGEIRVVNHGGDKRLGGKLFDWEIVEKLFIPHLIKQAFQLKDFHRGNKKWVSALAKLKYWAEDAKIKLSQVPYVPIAIESLCEDDRSRTVSFEFELQRRDLENLIEPFLLRSINIGKKVMADARLGPKDIEKVILVGGPTQSPFLRQLLADVANGFGIAIDSSVNPMTVVAQGAAIFAGTQRMPSAAMQAPPKGAHLLELDYKPVGADPEPFVGGQVVGEPGASFDGFTVEFSHADPRNGWRSGKILLGEDGKFLTSLKAGPGANTFNSELCDDTGRPVPAVPERISYTIGNVFTDPPLTHTLGIAMANNEVDVVFPKGTPLPCKGRTKHRTVKPIRKDQDGEWLTIPVVEGENERRADRNQLIGKVTIPSQKIKRDIPASSEIEIMLEVDTDYQIKAKAYLPMLDQEFKASIDYKEYHQRSQDSSQLGEEVAREMKRLEEVRDKAQ